MAKRITEFTGATSLAEGDLFALVDVSDTTQATSGTTKKSALSLIADYLKARVETLTNKTLTSPKINEDVELTATSTELNKTEDIAGDIVGTTDTQELTNKTLTSPVITGGTIDGVRPMISICHLYQKPDSAGQTITSGASTDITFGAGTELYDPLDWHSTSTNTSRITVGVAGLYYVYGSLKIFDNATETLRIFYIKKNGATFVDTRCGGDDSGRWSQYIAGVVSLTVNDYVEIGMSYTGGADTKAYTSSLGIMRV